MRYEPCAFQGWADRIRASISGGVPAASVLESGKADACNSYADMELKIFVLCPVFLQRNSAANLSVTSAGTAPWALILI